MERWDKQVEVGGDNTNVDRRRAPRIRSDFLSTTNKTRELMRTQQQKYFRYLYKYKYNYLQAGGYGQRQDTIQTTSSEARQSDWDKNNGAGEPRTQEVELRRFRIAGATRWPAE